jgi:hypothetical protein
MPANYFDCEIIGRAANYTMTKLTRSSAYFPERHYVQGIHNRIYYHSIQNERRFLAMRLVGVEVKWSGPYRMLLLALICYGL